MNTLIWKQEIAMFQRHIPCLRSKLHGLKCGDFKGRYGIGWAAIPRKGSPLLVKTLGSF